MRIVLHTKQRQTRSIFLAAAKPTGQGTESVVFVVVVVVVVVVVMMTISLCTVKRGVKKGFFSLLNGCEKGKLLPVRGANRH